MGQVRNIKGMTKSIAVFEFLDYREYLAAIFAALKAQINGYSYLELAVDLGFSRTNVLRLVIVGQRRLTPMTTARIVEALELSGGARRYFEALVTYGNARQPKQREAAFQDLLSLKKEALGTLADQASLEYFSEWYHPVLREMVGMPDFQSDPLWIMKRLHNSLMPRQISKSLELLVELGLIVWDEGAARHVLAAGQDTTNRQVDVMAAVRYHQKMIEIGRESITRISEARREVHGVTVRVSEATANRIKAILLQTCEDLLAAEKTAGDDADQIYQMNIQFFPFTKRNGSN